MSENKLVLGKTQSDLYGYEFNDDLTVKVDEYVLVNTTPFSYLGCVLDDNLSGVRMA